MHRLSWIPVVAVLASIVCTAGLAAGGEPTSVLDVNAQGQLGNNLAYPLDISDDGRFVVFGSAATNLVAGPNGIFFQIYWVDRQTGQIQLASADSNGVPAGGFGSENATVSADGRYVFFESNATNLVGAATNGKLEIFRRDMQTGATIIVTVDAGGHPVNGDCALLDTTPDGRFVVTTTPTKLVPADTNGINDVYVRDLSSSSTTLVSIDSGGGAANNASYGGSITDDGRFIAFESRATDLVSGYTNYGNSEAYVRDVVSGSTTLISKSLSGNPASNAYSPRISGDGSAVTFESTSTNLVPGDLNQSIDQFVYDVATGAIERVSVSSTGQEGKKTPFVAGYAWGFLSKDGRYATFVSNLAGLVPDDGGGGHDSFVHDRLTGSTTRIDLNSANEPPIGWTDLQLENMVAAVSADGRFAVFDTSATNFGVSSPPGERHVYLRDRGPWVDSNGPHPATGPSHLLLATGSLVLGEPGEITLVGAHPGAVAVLFIALSSAPVPFVGGVLQAFPIVASVTAMADATGRISFPYTMPAGAPSGLNLYLQYAVADPSVAPTGVALSNAVVGAVP